MRRRLLSSLLVVAAFLPAGVTNAENALIDYQGFAWEDGHFPISQPGDIFNLVAIVDAIDIRFGVDLGSEEVTIWVTDLLSTGQVDVGGGIFSVAFSGGTLQVWRDPSGNHEYGVNPPNGTAPSTFNDGSLLLGGALSEFFLFFDITTHTGAFESNVTFTSGSGLPALGQTSTTGYTFAGVLDPEAAGGNVPQGYDLQVDGTLEVHVRVDVDRSTWSAVKEMYR